MSHLLEAAIRGVDTAAHDAESTPCHLLAQQIIFRKRDLLVKAAQLMKLFRIEQHEHPGRKGMVQARKVLKEIVARIKQFVDPVAVAANNVRSHTMKMFSLRELNRAAHHRRMPQFDVGIEKKNVVALRLCCAQVAADRRHSAANHAHVQAVAETENNFPSAVG